jgi:hypothetical protein
LDKRFDSLFPRDLYGRLALGIASVFFFPLSCFIVVAILTRPPPQSLAEWLALAIVGQVFFAMALFFGGGLIWALATPRWLEGFLELAASRLLLALLLFMLPFGCLAIWSLFFA